MNRLHANVITGAAVELHYYYRPSPDGTRILFGGRDGTIAGRSRLADEEPSDGPGRNLSRARPHREPGLGLTNPAACRRGGTRRPDWARPPASAAQRDGIGRLHERTADENDSPMAARCWMVLHPLRARARALPSDPVSAMRRAEAVCTDGAAHEKSPGPDRSRRSARDT